MQPVISLWIAREYREVARTRLTQLGFQRECMEVPISTSLHVLDAILPPDPVPGRKRAPFLGLAQEAGACLVTWNVERFPKATRVGAAVSPDEYLKQLQRLAGW